MVGYTKPETTGRAKQAMQYVLSRSVRDLKFQPEYCSKNYTTWKFICSAIQICDDPQPSPSLIFVLKLMAHVKYFKNIYRSALIASDLLWFKAIQ